MKKKKTGIVIGKFYPLHKGHRHLIETALSQVDKLTVLVCDKKNSQKISGAFRALWIKEVAPQVRVIIVDDHLSDDDSEGWAKYTLEILGYVPDVVFTSEDYGDDYARFMGSKHVLVDKHRQAFPISATKIRSNPLESWDFLDSCVKAYFAKRICILGAESTGTTTLSQDMAQYYKTVWVPEFGRLYWEGKMSSPSGSQWSGDEFVFIARKQNELEDYLARFCNKILICDTNAFATSIWHERYVGFLSKEVDRLSAQRDYSLYILTNIDIPFIQDGTRDGEHIRHQMHQRFEEELKKRQKPYIIVSGSQEQRLKEAIKACNIVLKQKISL